MAYSKIAGASQDQRREARLDVYLLGAQGVLTQTASVTTVRMVDVAEKRRPCDRHRSLNMTISMTEVMTKQIIADF